MAWMTWNARPPLAVIAAVPADDCRSEVATQTAVPPAIALDGDLSDWPCGVSAISDGRWPYIRTELPAATRIQANRVPQVIALNYDGNAGTGRYQMARGMRHGVVLQIPCVTPAQERADPNTVVDPGALAVASDMTSSMWAPRRGPTSAKVIRRNTQ